MDMKNWEKGPLRVSGNGRYLMNGEEPFFWLGDTAWLLFQKCTLEEAYIYLKNRKDKGYNVIQAVLIHTMADMAPMGGNGMRLDVETEDYWNHCDAIISMAADLGLYMALLPSWGSLVKLGIITEENVERYGTFLADRYHDMPNVLWLLGGDIRGDDGLQVYRRLGTLLKQKNPSQLVGFHPFGRTSSSLWFHDEPWLDFNMYQSGHRRYDQVSLGEWDDNNKKETFFGEDNWRYVNRDHSHVLMKPTVDGEPSYEGIPQGLHDPSQPFWQACDARRYAYWSVFQGAMGHTYGNNAIMQFYNNKSVPGSYGVRELWSEALHHEGAGQMKHLACLMNSVDFINGRPAEELLASGQKEKYERISVFAGPGYILCYAYLGKAFTLDLSSYEGMFLEASWMDPVSGVFSYFGDVKAAGTVEFQPPRKPEGVSDWVLSLRCKS